MDAGSGREPVVLVACFPQRTRGRVAQALSLMTHLVQLFRVSLAVAHFRQLRVLLNFVNIRTVEIRKPCFDIPSRHDDYDRILGNSPWNAFFPALILKLRETLIRSEIVRIDYDEEQGSPLGPDRLQLMRIPFPHPLLTGLRPMRTPFTLANPSPRFPIAQVRQSTLAACR